MQEGFPFDVIKPWGDFRQFTLSTPCTVKLINVKENEVLSLQSHARRSEFWRVASGSGFAEIDGTTFELYTGKEVMVPVGAKHRIGAHEGGLLVLEIAFGDFDENDITRYEDKYGRADEI